MKKTIFAALFLAVCLCVLGCSQNQDNTSQVIQDNNNSSTSNDQQLQSEPSLPANMQEAYTCIIDNHEGQVYISDYEIIPDEMNEGMVVKTVTMTALFHDVDETFEIYSIVFPMNDSLEPIDESAWLIPFDSGDELIFEDINQISGNVDKNGTYRAEICISYSVPEAFDDLAVVLSAENSSTPMEQRNKNELISSNSLWFIMGSVENDTLSYHGSALQTAHGNVDINEMFNYGDGPSDEWLKHEQELEEQNQIPEDIGIELVFLNNDHLIDTSNSITLRLEQIIPIEADETGITVRVVVSQEGLRSTDHIKFLLFDAWNEVHIDEQNVQARESTITVEFKIQPESAPFTFTAGAWRNDDFLQKTGVYVDVDIKFN